MAGWPGPLQGGGSKSTPDAGSAMSTLPSGIVRPIETGGRGGGAHQLWALTRIWTTPPGCRLSSGPPPTTPADPMRTLPAPSRSAGPGGPSRMQSAWPMFVPVTVAIRAPAAPSQLSRESVSWVALQLPSAGAVPSTELGLAWPLGGRLLGAWLLGGRPVEALGWTETTGEPQAVRAIVAASAVAARREARQRLASCAVSWSRPPSG